MAEFRNEAAASGLSDWSKMNLDLYNFHLCLPATSLPQQMLSSPGSAHFPADNRNTSLLTPFCCSWNEWISRWAPGKCSFCHMLQLWWGCTLRSTAPFLTQLDITHVPPLQAGEGDGSDGLEAPCDAFVYSVYSSVTLPPLQNELSRMAKLLCSISPRSFSCR